MAHETGAPDAARTPVLQSLVLRAPDDDWARCIGARFGNGAEFIAYPIHSLHQRAEEGKVLIADAWLEAVLAEFGQARRQYGMVVPLAATH